MGAMDFFSDPQATALRFGDVIDDLHDVFRCHGIDFGSPDDFSAFARTLKYHSELRGDVMRVVKFVMESETNISFRTLLTILAVASGGPEVAACGGEMRVPVSLVIEALVGEGDSSPLNGAHSESSGPDPTANEMFETVALERSSLGSEEPAADVEVEREEVLEEPVIDTRDDSSTDSSMDHSPLMGRNDSNALAESLSRIEMNSLQLKIYLDSIEQRISRMEPRLENVPPVALSGSSAPLRDKARERFSVAVASATNASEAISFDTEAELSHNDPPKPASRQQGKAITGPLAVLMHLWSDEHGLHVIKRPRALPILGSVAMLLLAVTFAWWLGRDTGYVMVRPVNALAEKANDVSGSSPARAAASSAGDPLAGTADKPKAAVARNTSVPQVGKAPRDSSTPVDDDARQGERRSADTPVPSPERRVALRSLLSSSPRDTKAVAAMTDTSEDPDPTDRTSKLSSEPPSDRPVNVSSGVMEANLISGPKPSYPALAGLTHTRGDVVMLAVISKDGTVKDLHVIKGHRLLRSATKSAVRNWRYRPYAINGVPVDVSTLVSVDFSSPQ
jgi:TonB family protein